MPTAAGVRVTVGKKQAEKMLTVVLHCLAKKLGMTEDHFPTQSQ